MIAAKPSLARTAVETGKRRSWWQPDMWAGCSFPAWMRLLARHRFAVHPTCLVSVALVTLFSVMHTALRGIQQAIYGRRIRQTRIRHSPIFIIGHWRSGTTLLHELLSLDERHTSPTTYACMEPNHFLLTEKLFTRWLSFLTPDRRPMDDMAAGFDRPQEDEFALCMLGQPSPYWRIAFPNRRPGVHAEQDLEDLPPRAQAAWKWTFMRFLQELTFKDPRRLVLKSPPHSCRIQTLLELFPDARFVHIVRDPFVVFPSTVRLWKALYGDHALQKPSFAGLEEDVLRDFVRLHQKIEEGTKSLDRNRFYELRYEDLVRDPVTSMRRLYVRLDLGGFHRVVPRLRRHFAEIADYRTNRHQLTPQQRAAIALRWGPIIKKYGYAPPVLVTERAGRAALLPSDVADSMPAARR